MIRSNICSEIGSSDEYKLGKILEQTHMLSKKKCCIGLTPGQRSKLHILSYGKSVTSMCDVTSHKSVRQIRRTDISGV